MRTLKVTHETFPVQGIFRISRSALTEIEVVTVEIYDGGCIGRGECRPYPRYNETPDSVILQIEGARSDIENGASPFDLLDIIPAGAARNALDCALWDLLCKQSGERIWELFGFPAPKPKSTAYTLSIDSPENMAKAAKQVDTFSLLKLKLPGLEGLDCLRAVAAARPDARFIIDPNEAISADELTCFVTALDRLPIALIEQPCPAAHILNFDPSLCKAPLCADEALHEDGDLEGLWAQGYRAVNVKLDKAGGLTGALILIEKARRMGFAIMGGCMASTSLAVAPMVAISSIIDIADLDGPALLAQDRENGLRYRGGKVHPPSPDLWG